MIILKNEKKLILDLLYDEPYKLGHWVGFEDLIKLHNEWLKAFLYGEEDQTLLAHRGSYKTTVLSLFLAIDTVIKPNENILFFRKTDTDVAEVIKQARKVLDSPAMRKIVRILYEKELEIIKGTDSEIHTNLSTSTKGMSQIVGLGIGVSITGKHADKVVTDDIVNLKDRTSKAEREKTKLQYMELENIKNRGGRFINTGTPWHKEDAISIMPNVTRYDCYSTELMNKEEIKTIRNKMTDSLFAANYELKHIADKDTMFKAPKYTSEEKLIHNGVAHIDASYGGEDGSAFTGMKELRDGRIIGFGKRWDKHIDECLSEIKLIHKQLRLGTISCEKNADKGYLKKELVKMGLPAKTYSESMNKYIKISTYLKRNWANIYWLDGTDPEYINEILDYSENAAHDDAPDSAASILRSFSKTTSMKTFKGGL